MDTTRPTVREESEFSYVDKTTGKVLSFTPKANEAMVTFKGSAIQETLHDVLKAAPLLSVSQGYNQKHGFAAVYLNPQTDIAAVKRSLVDRPEVANILPVMIDEYGGARYFLPDEFTVRFNKDIDKSRAEQIIQDHGTKIVTTQRYDRSLTEPKK